MPNDAPISVWPPPAEPVQSAALYTCTTSTGLQRICGITAPAAAEWEPQPVRAGTAQEVIYALQPLPCMTGYANGGKGSSAAVDSVDNAELSVGSPEAASRSSAIIVSYVLGAILGVLMAGGVLLGAS